MAEIRTDPLGGDKTVIADDRADRPGAFHVRQDRPAIDPSKDPFAEGNEGMTPPEIWADRPDGGAANTPGWKVRAVPNLYPALSPDSSEPEPQSDPELFSSRSAQGGHEVIINSPDPVQSLADLSSDQLAAAVRGWQARVEAHAGAACRHLFVNEGSEAGASLPHTHAQLIALPFVPPKLAREREAFTAHASRTAGSNLLSDILAAEVRASDRIVSIDDEAVLLAPWASSTAFQLMIVPRATGPSFEAAPSNCSQMLFTALRILKARFEASPALNIWIRTQPSGADHWAWRIDILPRLAQPAGIELGTGLQVNPVAPERAAAELKALLPA
ncbi:MAG: hypothetical protein NTX07_07610 [Solirubrobacterales bacterium]|nr:hypothetical protein [Solirubrobacterales bacterium]